jgi:DNA-binding NarL/FixJ family response regulator
MLMKALQSKSPDVLQARMANALLLLADGLSVEDVAGLLFQSEETVAGWQKIFANRPSRAA